MTNRNDFAAEYATYEELKARFEAAGEAKDEAAAKAAREGYRHLEESLLSKGESYFRMFERYKDARERGNEYIDISEPLQDEEVEGLVETFRETGIEHFTFSSTWSGAVRTAWLFTKNGCKLEGLNEIRSKRGWILSGDEATTPAYLFSL